MPIPKIVEPRPDRRRTLLTPSELAQLTRQSRETSDEQDSCAIDEDDLDDRIPHPLDASRSARQLVRQHLIAPPPHRGMHYRYKRSGPSGTADSSGGFRASTRGLNSASSQYSKAGECEELTTQEQIDLTRLTLNDDPHEHSSSIASSNPSILSRILSRRSTFSTQASPTSYPSAVSHLPDTRFEHGDTKSSTSPTVPPSCLSKAVACKSDLSPPGVVRNSEEKVWDLPSSSLSIIGQLDGKLWAKVHVSDLDSCDMFSNENGAAF